MAALSRKDSGAPRKNKVMLNTEVEILCVAVTKHLSTAPGLRTQSIMVRKAHGGSSMWWLVTSRLWSGTRARGLLFSSPIFICSSTLQLTEWWPRHLGGSSHHNLSHQETPSWARSDLSPQWFLILLCWHSI